MVLPGGPALGTHYLTQALAPLATRRTMLFLDLRGRGDAAAAPAESLSIATDVTDLETVRTALGLGPLRLIGHHWGAGVAMLYATRHPVDRLALIGPMPDGVTTIFEFTRLPHDSGAQHAHGQALLAQQDRLDPDRYCRSYWGFSLSPAEETDANAIARLAPTVCDAPASLLRSRAVTGQALYASLGTWEWRDTMRLVAAPTLVVVGGRSASRTAAARLWATHVHDGRLLVLGDTPWFPWIEAAPAMNRDLVTFFDGRWPVDTTATTEAAQVSSRDP